MDQEIIRKIAEEVAHYLPDYHWALFAQIVITAVAAFLAAFFGGYFKTRGQNLATKQDFETLKEQLGAQTKVVETIRSEISQKDWAAREWTNVRRLKLEELLNKVAECEGYLERFRRATFSGTTLADDREYADELNSLATLYFPDMKKEVGAYVLIYRNLVVKTANLAIAYLKAGADTTARDVAADKYQNEVNTLFPERIKARSAIDNAARSLMEQIMGVQS